MRVLVTGGAGYIGSHTAKALARAGYEPVVLDNLSEGHRWAVQWGPLVEGDLGDRNLLLETLAAYQVKAAIHFAAHAYVGESVRNPRKYFRNNVANTLCLLETLLDCGVRHIVFSSTCATYGIPKEVPITEDQVQLPVNPYGESKRFVERALEWLGKADGLKWAALRYFNAAGADEEGQLGEDHDPETHLIPLAIQCALGRRSHLEVYGTDYPTPDGTAVRDYIHVSDLADAHVLALRHLLKGGENVALNLGTGKGHSVREVVTAAERISGAKVDVRETDRRPGDPPMLVADARKAGRVLGWSPRLSRLDQIIKTAWQWHSAREKVAASSGAPRGEEFAERKGNADLRKVA